MEDEEVKSNAVEATDKEPNRLEQVEAPQKVIELGPSQINLEERRTVQELRTSQISEEWRTLQELGARLNLEERGTAYHISLGQELKARQNEARRKVARAKEEKEEFDYVVDLLMKAVSNLYKNVDPQLIALFVEQTLPSMLQLQKLEGMNQRRALRLLEQVQKYSLQNKEMRGIPSGFLSSPVRDTGETRGFVTPLSGGYDVDAPFAPDYQRLQQTFEDFLLFVSSNSSNEEKEGGMVGSLQPSVEESVTIHVEIDEDPLTLEQMGMLFSTLTTLTTKYWLISQGRFADLIEFSKSHDERFVREAQAVITRLSYNSPFNFDVKVGATDVAQALVTTIDGITQREERLKQIELANKAKEQELQQAEQRFAEEVQRLQQQEAFEQEKRQLELARQQIELERLRLEVEKQRLELVALRLDAQRKSLDHAFEIAHKVIGQLHPQADDATKRMLVQTYVGEILQLSGIAFTSVTIVEVDTAPSAQKEKEE